VSLEVSVLLFLLLVILAVLTVLVDQAEFELVEVLGAEFEFARGVFAALNLAVNYRGTFRFLALFLIAH
jgi:hypothetical protein